MNSSIVKQWCINNFTGWLWNYCSNILLPFSAFSQIILITCAQMLHIFYRGDSDQHPAVAAAESSTNVNRQCRTRRYFQQWDLNKFFLGWRHSLQCIQAFYCIVQSLCSCTVRIVLAAAAGAIVCLCGSFQIYSCHLLWQLGNFFL